MAEEWNPLRPTVPEEVREVSPALYDYLSEQASILRDNYQRLIVGDAAIPSQGLGRRDDNALYALGSIGRFNHPIFGQILARYVKFDYMNPDVPAGAPVGLVKDLSQVEWTVTNQLFKSDSPLAVGLLPDPVVPVSGSFGWVIITGPNLQNAYVDDSPLNGLKVGWNATGILGLAQYKIATIVGDGPFTPVGLGHLISPGQLRIDALSSATQSEVIDIDVDGLNGTIERIELDIKNLGEQLQIKFDSIRAEFDANTDTSDRSLLLLQERIATISSEEIRSTFQQMLNLSAQYKHIAETAMGEALKAKQGSFINLNATNQSKSQARIYADESRIGAESSSFARNEAILQSNFALGHAEAAAESSSTASAFATDAGNFADAAQEWAVIAASAGGGVGLNPNSDFEAGNTGWFLNSSGYPDADLTELPNLLGKTGVIETPTGVQKVIVSELIPWDTARAMRISARWRTSANTDLNEKVIFYIGFASFDAAGASTDTGTFGTFRYPITSGGQVSYNDGWQFNTATVSGVGNANQNQFPAGTTQVRLVAFLNYPGWPGSVNRANAKVALDLLLAEDYESATQAAFYAGAAASSAATASTHAGTAGSEASSAISAKTSAESARDAALGYRDQAHGYRDDASSFSGTASGAASTATTQANLATSYANLAARATGGKTLNPAFLVWSNPATYPEGWYAWSGAAPARVAGVYGYGAKFTDAGGTTNQGMVTSGAYSPAMTKLPRGYYFMYAEIELVSGSLDGAGLHVNNVDSGDTPINLDFTTEPDISGVVRGAGTAGRRYTFRKLINITVDRNDWYIYAMAAWVGFNNGSGAAKEIIFHRVDLLPGDATDALVQIQAGTLTTHDAALGILDSRTSDAYLDAVVVAGSAVSAVRLLATAGGSSSVALEAEEIQLYNNAQGVRKKTMDLVNGKGTFYGDLDVLGAMRIGSLRIPVALQSFSLRAADGEVISFGADLGRIPELSFDATGLIALGAGEAYQLSATSLSSTGFTMIAKKVVAGTPTLQNATGIGAGGSGNPRFTADKPTSADAYNNSYNVGVTQQVSWINEGPNFWQASWGFDIFANAGSGWTQIGSLGGTLTRNQVGIPSASQNVGGTISYGGVIGLHGGKEFGVQESTGGYGILTAFGGVSYYTASTTISTASPGGEKAQVLVIPQNR